MTRYRNNSKTVDSRDSKVLQFPDWDAEAAAIESAARVAFLEQRFLEALDKMLDLGYYSGVQESLQRVAVLDPHLTSSGLLSCAPAPRQRGRGGS